MQATSHPETLTDRPSTDQHDRIEHRVEHRVEQLSLVEQVVPEDS